MAKEKTGISGLGLAVVFASCSPMVAQDAKSGADAKAKGAQKIRIGDDGEGTAKGIVTYPAATASTGRSSTCPRPATSRSRSSGTPPKDGEDLSFNVLDDTFHIVRRVAPTPDTGKTVKKAELSGLIPGKYYVQIYASNRGDAGAYEVKVHWAESRGAVVLNADPFPNPPAPARRSGCRGRGRRGSARQEKPKGSKENPCQVGEQCPQGALFVNPACPTVDPMPIGTPCPPPPAVNPACPDAGPLAPGTPCPQTKKAAKIIERQSLGQEVQITIDKGSKPGFKKVSQAWSSGAKRARRRSPTGPSSSSR